MTTGELLCLPCLDTFDVDGTWTPIETPAITVTLTGALCRQHVVRLLERERSERQRRKDHLTEMRRQRGLRK